MLSQRIARVVLIASVAVVPPAWAQESNDGESPSASSAPRVELRWMQDRDWFVPLIADPKPPAFTFAFPMVTDAFEFSQEPGRRLTWEVNVGKEVPIVYLANYTPSTPIAGRWGLGLWVAVSFHVLEELGKDPSNPIINTDYRFSLATLKYRRILRASGVQNAHYLDLKADLWHHESTHLGDEFVIGAQKVDPSFERINVSYEFWDVAASYERRTPSGDDASMRYVIRGGLLGVWPYAHGYYSDHTLAVDSRRIPRSKRNLEPYAQFEWWAPHRLRTGSDQARQWAPFVSVDARYKTVYDYHKLSDDQSEDKQWSLNLMAGIRTAAEGSLLSIKDVYVRYYRGVNPHGQLRNQPDFTTFGVGVNFNLGQRSSR
jgi:hypothetical protein